MPVHDWSRMLDGDFHHFHQRWIQDLAGVLNQSLPSEYMALAEQVTSRPQPDVVTLQVTPPSDASLATLTRTQPQTRIQTPFDRRAYARRADRIAIRHGRGRVVAIIEIVSHGNKSSRAALRSFLEKTTDFLEQGIHVLVVDVHLPTPRDPRGIQSAILEEFDDVSHELPPNQPLTVGSYRANDVPTAFIETFAVGDSLPTMPIYLTDAEYLPVPLEATYMQAWSFLPVHLRQLLESPTPS